MKTLLGVLMVATVFSGCLAGEETMTTTNAPPPEGERMRMAAPTSLTFSDKLILGRVDFGAEPSVAAAPDGTLYVTTPLAMWRSDDDGATWTNLGGEECLLGTPTCPGTEVTTGPDGLEGGGDADIWVTPDGRVHWLGLFGSNARIPYQYSDDKGVTWSPPFDVSLGKGSDREWITGRADGTLFASWRNGDPRTIQVSVSRDNGATWTTPSDIAPDTRQGGVAVDPSSNALALAHDLGGAVEVAHSFNEGVNWTSVPVVKNPRQGQVFPVTAFDGGGTLYLAYAADKDPTLPASPQVRPFERTSVYLHVSHDKGLTWSNATQLNPPGTTAWFPWIVAGAEGKVAVVWYQNDQGMPRYTADRVHVMMALSVDADYQDAKYTVARISEDPIHMGPECREVPPCRRSLLDFFEVGIHPDGFAVVTWAEDLYPVPLIDVAFAKMTGGPNLLQRDERAT